MCCSAVVNSVAEQCTVAEPSSVEVAAVVTVTARAGRTVGGSTIVDSCAEQYAVAEPSFVEVAVAVTDTSRAGRTVGGSVGSDCAAEHGRTGFPLTSVSEKRTTVERSGVESCIGLRSVEVVRDGETIVHGMAVKTVGMAS